MVILRKKILYYEFGIKRLVFSVLNPYLGGTFLPFQG